MEKIKATESKAQDIKLNNCYLSFLALPFIVFIMVLYWPLIGSSTIDLTISADSNLASHSVKEASNRYDVISLTVLIVAACVAVTAYAFCLMFALPAPSRRKLFITFGLLAILVAIVMRMKSVVARWIMCRGDTANALCPTIDDKYMIVAPRLFSDTLGQLPYSGGRLTELLSLITNFVNISVAIAALAVALATCAQLVSPATKVPAPQIIATARTYASQMKTLNRLLYASAVVLVLGILHVQQWLQWPEAFLDSKTTKEYAALKKSYLTLEGTLFTTLLASIYLPAALSIRARVERLYAASLLLEQTSAVPTAPVDEDGGNRKPSKFKEWLAEIGWPTIGGETFTPVFSILSPLVAPPIMNAVENVLLIPWPWGN